MITIFTIPKPFDDSHISIIQKNALKSWKALGNEVEIIILGDDLGIREIALEIDVEHIPGVKVTKFGTPLLDSAFDIVQKQAKNNILMYSNADMMYMNDLIDSIRKIKNEKFLGVGRRIDLDIKKEIDFNNQNSINDLNKKVDSDGQLHSSAGMDYFIFKKNSLGEIPPLVVGRVGWDNWMILNAKRNNIPIIDMTRGVRAIHQNHQYFGKSSLETRKTNEEALGNLSYLGSKVNVYTTDDSNFRLEKGVIKKNFLHFWPHLKRRVSSLLSFPK